MDIVMEKLLMCRICLNKDVRMHCLVNTNLQEIYELLTGNLLETKDPRPVHACYVCCARLRNCLQLRSACLHSEELFTRLLDNDDCEIKTIQVRGMLRTVAVIHVSHPVVQTELEPEPTTDEQLNNQHVGEREDYNKDQGIFSQLIKQEDIKCENLSSKDDELDYSIQSVKVECCSDSDNAFLENDTIERYDLKSNYSITSENLQDSYKMVLNSSQKAATVTKTLTSTDLEDTSQNTHLNNTDNKEILTPNISEQNMNLWQTVHMSNETHCSPPQSNSFKHIRSHTGDKQHKCNICGKGFNRKYDLSKHIRTHTGERPYKCNICGRGFIQKFTLTKHIRIHTGEKPYKCSTCGKYFKQKYSLSKHISVHTGEKLYKCGTCGKDFSRKYDLVIHIRTHGENPYKCDKCGEDFNEWDNLLKHIRVHTGAKVFKCDTCGKSFRRRQILINHFRIHTGEKPYKCHTCGKDFNYKGNLSRHNLTHIRDKPNKCGTFK